MCLPIVLKFLLNLTCLLISIQVLEILALFGNCFAFKVAITIGKVFWFETLCAIFGIHRVNEGGLFVVAEIG